jgi:hypothetical protein
VARPKAWAPTFAGGWRYILRRYWPRLFQLRSRRGHLVSYEPPPLLGISKRFRSTWVVNCNARRAVFLSTWDACVSTSILEDACLYPHPLSPSICAGDRRGGVESIADNDVVNLPEFAAMAAGVPMITRCDHSAEKGVGGRSPRQQRALPSLALPDTCRWPPAAEVRIRRLDGVSPLSMPGGGS